MDRSVIDRMCAALEHRGPDSRGIHVDATAGLGIQRLRIIDLATGDQPIFNEDKTIAVVLNGEIYNFEELRSRLRQRGHRFSTAGDTEVIAHLYEDHGPGFVNHLHGMFALAVWDREQRRLILARDRVGKKPLFYCGHQGQLAFASELRALLQDPEIPRDIDHRALDAYMALRWIPAPLSAFRAVRKLPPATVLVHENGKSRLQRYWQLDYSRKRTFVSEDEMHEELREQLRLAVRRRLISDVPLGAFLSGGVDSSAVVAAMAEVSSQPVRTFSIGFTSDRYNELPRARLVAERFGTVHEELVVEPHAVEILPRIVRHYGEPFADSSAIPSFYVAEMARRSVTVALNGDGGDESFAGYGRYVSNLALHHAQRLPEAARRGIGTMSRRLRPSPQIDSWTSRVRRAGNALQLSPGQTHAAYLSQLSEAERFALYTDDFADQVGPPLIPELFDRLWTDGTATNPLDHMLEVDVQTYLPDQLLAKIDIATMAHSLEGRSPLLDHELMEFAASLPPRAKLRGTQGKRALRGALAGWVPDEILSAPKQGFVAPVAEWLRSDLRELAYDVLLDSSARSRGWLKPDGVKSLLDSHCGAIEDRSAAIWTLLILELWQREVEGWTPTG